MKRNRLPFILLILLGWLLSIGFLGADVNILMMPSKLPKKLPTVKLENRDYVALEEVSKLFHTAARAEYSEYNDQRVSLWLNGQQFIFLLNSPFYSFGEDVFNMSFPFVQDRDDHYIPSHFFLTNLPQHFPASIKLVDGVLQLPTPKDKGVLRIVLDPGHGGHDPGAVGKNKVREKDINLSVSLLLRNMLQKELGVEILMTRSDDTFVSLAGRTKFAMDKKADIFVSIHTNSSTSSSARGIETYYLATRSTTDSRAVEALENGVVELYEGAEARKKYDALDFILSDMSQTEFLEFSNTMATLVQRNMVSGLQGRDRGVKQANFYVLRGAFMPAILVEMGFISNLEEEALLANPQYQERIARTIFEGLKRFKHNYDRVRKIG